MTEPRNTTVACEMGHHTSCLKGRHNGCDAPYIHWCQCPCHPFEVHVPLWDRLRQRVQLPPALRRAVNRIERL